VTSVGLDRFRHEALLYAGHEGFLSGMEPFIRDAAAACEPVLVIVSQSKIDGLRATLGDLAGVEYEDVGDVGRNPAWIMPVWQDFLDRHAGRGRLRGIGEPIDPTRSDGELVECQRHEALLNLAFEGGPAWWLLCPYDTAALSAEIIDEVGRTHPWLRRNGDGWASTGYVGAARVEELLVQPLPPPTCDVRQRWFDVGALREVRELVQDHAAPVLGPERTADLVLAVSEVAANSVLHGGGFGVARVWHDEHRIVCEVSDVGHIDAPLAGFRRPDPVQPDGRGMYIVNQLCDLVEVRSYPGGSTVRVHMYREAGAAAG
jgi:anti-sigma regulatory factor (Ser/Thr protein kinase)